MNNVILIPSGSFTSKEIQKLESAGYVVLVTDEPDKIKFMNSMSEDMMLAALEGLTKSITGHEIFVKSLFNRLNKK